MSQPTLFKYFTKSPAVNKESAPNKTPGKTPNKTPVSNRIHNSSTPLTTDEKKGKDKKAKLEETLNTSGSNDEVSPEIKAPSGKRARNGDGKMRKRLRLESDSEDEYKPEENEESSDDTASDAVSSRELTPVSEDDEEEEEDEEDIKPTPKRKGQSNKSFKPKTPKTTKANLSDSAIAKLSAFAAPISDLNTSVGILDSETAKEWPHLRFDFLQPEKIKDKKGRRPDHPDYNPKTILIPDSFLKKQTPAHVQWWKFKSDHFDTLLFFKMGKFYETFHMDAVIAVNELNLLYMRGEYAHAGFPEKVYRKYSDILLRKGYKIARVEQTETPEQRDERCKSQRVVDKVVSREICRITTPATRTSSVLDAEPSSPYSTYLLAISEPHADNQDKDKPVFGVCFIETSVGKFHLGQFVDDRYCSNLRTLFTCYPPAEVLLERSCVSSTLQQTLNFSLPSAIKVFLRPVKEFWDPTKTMKTVQEEYYTQDLPELLTEMTDSTDALHQKPKEEFRYALKAFGAVVYYLKECLIDEELLTMKVFEKYEPSITRNEMTGKKALIIDSVSLKNLEIFENALGGAEGTLFDTIDHCSTKFGKRLLRSWLCTPLCSTELINDRLDAVEDLRKAAIRPLLGEICEVLHKLPDLERLLSKIHTQGCARRSKIHPDSRAVLFESGIYSKRKIMDFLSVIDGFKCCLEVREKLEAVLDSFSSKLLRKCILLSPEGYFPEVSKVLDKFDHAFDHKVAKKEGRIIPNRGVDPDYDSAVQDIKDIEALFEKHRRKVAEDLGCKVSFVSAGKSRYQLEIPENFAKRCSDEFTWISSRKGFRRYHTGRIKTLLSELNAAEEKKEKILKDIMRKIFESFDNHFHDWSSIVKCIGLIDSLISFCKFCNELVKFGGQICRPMLETNPDMKPFIRVEQATHPCLLKYCPNFVPNDLQLHDQLLLLTGPNMGGKSTLMRQTGLIAIIAQIGCFVPAKSCVLTPIDAIFTRLGAYDRIMEGHSTFFVELSETSLIVKNATRHSLVLLDELGRGTSTYDGTAIASAVIDHLINKINCRTLFSTHYHSLIEEFATDKRVRLGHMACMVENENEEDPSQESITFLYQLAPGACPKSYGFNAAKLAGIDQSLIKKAHVKAKEFEAFSSANRLIQKLISCNTAKDELRDIVKNLQSVTIKF